MIPFSNFKGGTGVYRKPFISNLIIKIAVITLIANETGKLLSGVEGRTWPRHVENLVDCHHKREIYSKSASNMKDYNTSSPTSAALKLKVPEEEAGAASEINSTRISPPPLHRPSPLHLENNEQDHKNGDDDGGGGNGGVGDYQDFNGNTSSRCKRTLHSPHHHNHSSSNNGRWTSTTTTNCIAGPFHLGADVNESIYNKLCPFPSNKNSSHDATSTNGKFPIRELQCTRDGDWYTECSQSSSAFTINKCENEQSYFDAETGECVDRGRESSSLESTPSSVCPMDHEKIPSDDHDDEAILQWTLLQITTTQPPTALQIPEESRVSEVAQDLQSLEQDHNEPEANGNDDFQLENLCKLSSSISNNHGLHPHPHDCTKYIQCSGDSKGTFFLKNCGPGTVFNPDLLVCDWPANVPQCNENVAGSGNGLRKKRMSGESREIELKRCNFSGIKPDPQFCNKYRLCDAGGRESVHTCGLGTVFNSLSGVCDYADQVDCQSRPSDLATYGCDTGDHYRASHPDHCNKFLECQEATLHVKTCPPGTLYDRIAERCDHAFKVPCRKPVSLEHDIDINWKSHGKHEDADAVVIKRKRRSSFISPSRFSRNSIANRLNLACEFNYIAPHPTSCTRFVECEQGKIYVKSCGPGTAFNGLIGKCDWPANVREPDPQDCTRYRQCSIRRGYQTRSCPQGQYFDENRSGCVHGSQNHIRQCSRRAPPTYFTTARTTTTTPRYFAPPTPA